MKIWNSSRKNSWVLNFKAINDILLFTTTSKRTVSGSACVHKRWGLTRGPQSWLATRGRSVGALAAGPWETGGRHPNVITAAKLLSIKAKLQKYAPQGLVAVKKESGDWVAAAQWKWSHVEFAGIYPAKTSRFHSCWQASAAWTCGTFYGNSLWINWLFCCVSDE